MASYLFYLFGICLLCALPARGTDCVDYTSATVAYLPMGFNIQTASNTYPSFVDFQGLRLQIASNGQVQVC
jgi:hypothetical protein